MEKRLHKRTSCAKRRVSQGADKETSNRHQPSTPDHENGVRISRQLCCWLREKCAGKVALQLLTAVLLLLLVWLLVELHVVLPCLFFCACLFEGPLWRAANTAWAWLTAIGGAKAVEKTPHADGGTEVV